MEKPEHLRLVGEPEAADLPGPLGEIHNAFGCDIHVCLRVDPARNRQAHEFEFRLVVFAGLGIAPRGYDASFHRAHARDTVQLGRECLGRELFLRYVRQDAPGIEEYGVPADRQDDRDAGTWTDHVELGLWGDVVLVAPATAHTLAGMVEGRGDSLLLTVLLSAKCPVVVAPAMDRDMFTHPATTANLEALRSRGVHVIDPDEGELASGLEGKGRLAEPDREAEIVKLFSAKESVYKAFFPRVRSFFGFEQASLRPTELGFVARLMDGVDPDYPAERSFEITCDRFGDLVLTSVVLPKTRNGSGEHG